MSWQERSWSRRKSGAGSGRVAVFCYARGCGFFGLVLKDSTSEPKSCWAAPRERRESRSMTEPSWATWSPGYSCCDCSSHWSCCWNHQALQSYFHNVRLRRRVLWPASEPCQVPLGFALSLFFHCFWSEGGQLNCKPFQHSAIVFPYSMLPSTGPVIILPLSWKTTLDVVFGKCFYLFSGEHPFLGKTLSFVHSFINIVVVIAIFQ